MPRLLIIAVTACLLASTATADDSSFFEQKVRPILVDRCLGCHSAEQRVRGGLRLDSREGWSKGGDSGPAVVPGDLENSPLVKAIRYDDADLKMPPKGKLPEAEVAVLNDWVKRGAFDPRVGPSKAVTKGMSVEEGRKHWAFQPLARVEPPQVRDPAWARNPIDRFILAKLESKGMAPAPEASRATLARRASLDLVGLPPTIADLDQSEDINFYESYVGRLLASPRHGERWARHWLDLARFAESHGFEHDYDRPSAYHYRDFVIEALNRDLPYDSFVKWQLAGDEIAPADNLALKATGFLAAGVHSTQITANQVEKERYDELDDIAATAGTAMLGLTIGCARCHDHKYDPIPQKDYYRFLSTFTTTVRGVVDLPLEPSAVDHGMTPTVKALISSEGIPAVRLHTQGGDFLEKTHFLKRGDPAQKQGEASQGFLQVLMSSGEQESRWQVPTPEGSHTSMRRTALANWMTDVDKGAGALLARVIVNRLWQHHFGRGLVATPSDFGTQGDRPSHPELLDWLAGELVRGGWRLRPIHRLMMTSATYRQSAQGNEADAKADPENVLCGRRSRRRLEAEPLRDAMLSLSGTMDGRMYGPGSLDEGMKRRSIYFTVKRSKLVPMMLLLDAPDALSGLAVRSSTTIAPQSLMLINSPVVRGYAEGFAAEVAQAEADAEGRIRLAYRRAIGRPPSAAEQADAARFLAAADLADFCQVLLGLNEFAFVE